MNTSGGQQRRGAGSKRWARGCANGGFTLIEVMVALAIVAVTLGAGIRAAGAMTGSTERLAQVTSAQWCADNLLTNMRLSKLYPPVGDSDFKCVQLDRAYTGKQVVRQTPNINFRRVEAKVLDEDGNPLVTITTIVGR